MTLAAKSMHFGQEPGVHHIPYFHEGIIAESPCAPKGDYSDPK
jgi:hypothetical protein